MNLDISIYNKEDEVEWLDVHASVMVDSYAWWIVIHKKPSYKNEIIDLVAKAEGKIVGFITIEINSEVIDIVKEDYGFAWEFGVHRDFRGNGIGKQLIEEAHDQMKKEYGINKSIWFSQDEKAQRYYETMGMKEIERHWQLSIQPSKDVKELLMNEGMECWEIRGSCTIDKLDKVKSKYQVIEDDDALKPKICVGYEYVL